ncbi:MAG TPA: hypothetical protein VMV92_35020 [Streptosporangiaceae bacterium]|nr:hypothetical protein [Streptosporangiaceae bacterium]
MSLRKQPEVQEVLRLSQGRGIARGQAAKTPGPHRRAADGKAAVVPEHGTVKRGTLASILRQAGLTPLSS